MKISKLAAFSSSFDQKQELPQMGFLIELIQAEKRWFCLLLRRACEILLLVYVLGFLVPFLVFCFWDAAAAVAPIRASSFGLHIAGSSCGSGWPDEFVVFTLATLPILELRGAIPVGYWMQLKPTLLTIYSWEYGSCALHYTLTEDICYFSCCK